MTVNNNSTNLFGNSIIQNEINSGLGAFGIGATALVINPAQSIGILAGQASSNPIGFAQSVVANGVQQTAGTGAAAIGQAVGAGVSAAVAPLNSWLQGLTSGSTTTRVAVGIVAVILLLAGIFFLANNKTTTINVSSLKGAVA
jgi:hypothetical protein